MEPTTVLLSTEEDLYTSKHRRNSGCKLYLHRAVTAPRYPLLSWLENRKLPCRVSNKLLTTAGDQNRLNKLCYFLLFLDITWENFRASTLKLANTLISQNILIVQRNWYDTRVTAICPERSFPLSRGADRRLRRCRRIKVKKLFEFFKPTLFLKGWRRRILMIGQFYQGVIC